MSEPDGIIAGLYEAAALPERWGDALCALASFTRSRSSHFLDWETATEVGTWGAVGWVPGAGVDPAADDHYRQYYGANDPRRPFLQASIGSVWNCAEHLDDGVVPSASELYNDFLVPNGVRWTMCLTARRPGGGFLMLSSLRSLAEGSYGEEEKRRLAYVAPHITQIYRLRGRLAEAQAKSNVAGALALAALEQSALGIVVCDPAGRVRYANPAARSAATGRGLSLAGSRVGSDQPDLAARLAGSIRAATTPVPGTRCGIGRALRVRRDPGQGDLSILIAPLPAEATPDGVPSGPAAMLFIEIGPSGSAPLGRHLIEWFGLTSAQARLALDLLRGAKLDEIAEARAVGITTLRTQLSDILAKTDTKRQAELLALLARLPRRDGD